MGEQTKGRSGLLVKVVKSKWTLWIAGALIILIIGNGMGKASAKTTLNEEMVKYKELITEIEKKKSELISHEDEIKGKQEEKEALDDEKKALGEEKKSVLDEISKHQAEFDEAMEVSKNKDSLLKEISSHEKDLNSKKSEIEKLDGEIASKNKDLDNVNEAITKKQEEPIQLNAGEYIVGLDFPAGRYQATNVGDGSNFFVYDASGSNKVNTILGGGMVGSGDYVFFADEFDTIETRGKVKLIPVE